MSTHGRTATGALTAGAGPGGDTSPTVVRAWITAWFAIAATAVGNGVLREALLVPRLGEARAEQVSTGMLLGAIGAAAGILGSARPLPDRAAALRVGGTWSVSTVVFELGLGLLRRRPLRELAGAYRLSVSRPWALVPLGMAVAPVVAHRVSSRVARATDARG